MLVEEWRAYMFAEEAKAGDTISVSALHDLLDDRGEAISLLRDVLEQAPKFGFCEAIRKFLGDADATE